MSQTRDAVGSSSEIAGKLLRGEFTSPEDVQDEINEAARATGITTYVLRAGVRELVNGSSTGDKEEALALLDDASAL